jgi:hypothetical protein
LSLPADNFYAFKDSIEVYAFMKGTDWILQSKTIIPFKIND